jgi:quinoprotein glucose dehydrogenase
VIAICPRSLRAARLIGWALAAALLASCAARTGGVARGDWPAYGRDPGGMRHAPLTQIDRANVAQLVPVWTYRTGELATYTGTSLGAKAAFEATPLMVDGTLYLSTPTNRVIALDAATGVQRWVYDPKLDLKLGYSEVTSRGVATWVDPGKKRGQPGYRRLYVGTLDGRIIALDAATGQPLADFGERGVVDLKPGANATLDGQYQVTSPPAVIGDLVITGNAYGDNRAVETPRGIVRALDARSGAVRWSWDPIPQSPGDAGYETWTGALAHRTGSANVWPPISVDPARDLVFLPTTSPSPDYYGGERKGQNLFANCVVALRASTGKLVWYFQTVHHDLWDYDVPMQPVLIELGQGGRAVPAVVIGTKVGHVFVLHRETGVPLFPVEERAVPQTTVPGEETWPTQPFPVNLPAFGLRRVDSDEAWGPTPADMEIARQRIGQLRFEGPYTPVGLAGTIEAPSNTGGFNWGGLSYDPARGIAVGAVNRFAAIVRLYLREQAPARRGPNVRLEAEIGEMRQTPYVVERTYLFNFERGLLPFTKPPWGTLAGVNLKTGALQFEVPLGTMFDPARFPDAERWGSISLGGPMTTAGGLVFIAATRDNNLRAFDIETGTLLWKAPLPAGAQAAPMSYEVDGIQYVVICAGGHGKLGTAPGDYVVAFALPRRR